MKIFVFPALFLYSILANAAPDPQLCKMFGLLAQGIAEDRDNGTSYKTEYAKLIAASADLPSSMGVQAFSRGAIKTIYMDMPKLTPAGANSLHYVACLSAR